jgi:sulfite exporter TauE/SafE
MTNKLTQLWDAFKLAFDSLVRTYSPMLIGAIAGFLTTRLNLQVTPEVSAFIAVGVAFIFSTLWYGISRLWEVITGRVSKLLTLGIVKSRPVVYSPLSDTELAVDEAAAVARKQIAHGNK